MRTFLDARLVCAAALTLLVCVAIAGAQPRTSPRARRSAAELQRLFDTYALAQAQDALKLTDEQSTAFITRMKALQDVRHRNQQARLRLLRQLAQLTSQADVKEGELRDRLKALREQEATGAVELQKAYAAVDEVLDTRQQARFRLFEDSIERKKFDLLTRARMRGRRPNPEPER